MKLKAGKEYKDVDGNLLDVVYQHFNYPYETRKLCIVVHVDRFNNPLVFPVDGKSIQLGSQFRKDITECIGDCNKPVYKEFKNGNGQTVEYLVNYCTLEGFHLGIVHVSAMEDAIRLFKEDGKIVVPLRDSDSDKENLILK